MSREFQQEEFLRSFDRVCFNRYCKQIVKHTLPLSWKQRYDSVARKKRKKATIVHVYMCFSNRQIILTRTTLPNVPPWQWNETSSDFLHCYWNNAHVNATRRPSRVFRSANPSSAGESVRRKKVTCTYTPSSSKITMTHYLEQHCRQFGNELNIRHWIFNVREL